MNWPDWKLVATVGILLLIGYGAMNIEDLVRLIEAAK